MSISVSASGPIEIDSDWPRLIHITWHVKSFKERAVDADRSVQKDVCWWDLQFSHCVDRLVLWEVLSLDTFGPSTLSMGALHGLCFWFYDDCCERTWWIMIITKYDTYMCTASCERILHRRCGDSGFRWFFSCSAGLSKANPMASLVPSQCPMRKPVLPYLGSSSPTLARSEPSSSTVSRTRKSLASLNPTESIWIQQVSLRHFWFHCSTFPKLVACTALAGTWANDQCLASCGCSLGLLRNWGSQNVTARCTLTSWLDKIARFVVLVIQCILALAQKRNVRKETSYC